MGARILIIEDEPAIAETLVYALNNSGFNTELATTADAGLAAFAGGCFDFIVLDVGLPDRDGFEVCRDLRVLSDVPILFLTARADEIDRVVGLELGADDYVTKPFSPRELTARIKAILRRSERAAPAEAPASLPELPIAWTEDGMAVVYFGERVDLSSHELALMRVLLERPGWVFGRDALIEAGWGDRAAVTSRAVDTHVKTLRAKLRAVRATPDALITHRGLGYALRSDW